jgi:protein phosphatase
VYHYRADTLTQVTRDQTLAQRMVDLGQLTPKEALTHPARNEVIQALGHRPEIVPAAYELALAAGDWLVVACDGLHAHVEHPALQDAVRRAAPSAAALAQQLVELADQGGGTDNCTVTVIRCY